MKKIALIIILMLIAGYAIADEIICPFTTYPREVQKRFAEHGYKVDLDGNDRTPESWAFLDNRGSELRICTYQPITKKGFDTITKVLFRRNDGKDSGK